ncbi:12451_t:CDS:2 [Ambispora leptoticha]|uniref:12451_t:CDS:1 n=1 Tax=Ambispora leptoticha TaxID=144679 RepID=A0A9N9B2C9_9GLOM|nr:12451_t:CDS:2 [Ambispora leptoticha]
MTTSSLVSTASKTSTTSSTSRSTNSPTSTSTTTSNSDRNSQPQSSPTPQITTSFKTVVLSTVVDGSQSTITTVTPIVTSPDTETQVITVGAGGPTTSPTQKTVGGLISNAERNDNFPVLRNVVVGFVTIFGMSFLANLKY